MIVNMQPMFRKSHFFMICFPGLLALILSSCSKPQSDTSNTSAAPSTDEVKVFLGMSVPDLNALPACDNGQAGRVVYVIAERGFRICSPGQANGEWTPAALSPNPEKPEDVYQKAFALYAKYRKSVIRIRLQCVVGSTSQYLLGTGFICGQQTICTAAHVLTCPSGTDPAQMNFHRVTSDRDSIEGENPADDLPPAFLMIPGEEIAAWVKTHPSKDLAKIQTPVSASPPEGTSNAVGAIPQENILPLASRPASESVRTLSWTLNMGFPLGFTDLYTDLGRVNANSLSSCKANAYPCLSGNYDFSTTNDTDKGSSGSPLLNLDGEVVGAVTAGTDGENINLTWAIDASLFSGF